MNRQMDSFTCSDRQTDMHVLTDRQTNVKRGGQLTISYQLHSNNAASRHEVGELVIERLALVDSIELLCLPKRQLAHLHFAAGAMTSC
jgi:hypothetical protein